MSNVREIICIVCPKGCHLLVDEKTLDVTGYLCDKGVDYGKNEIINPVRTLTSTVGVRFYSMRCPVKTDGKIPKSLIFDVMDKLCEIEVCLPISVGDVILEDVCNTGVNIVATRNIK